MMSDSMLDPSRWMPEYKTAFGECYVTDSLPLVADLPPDCVDLILTSPPYALHFKKEYGNEPQDRYLSWFRPFAEQFWRILKPTGSFVLNVGGAWQPGRPTRSLYHFELLIMLCKEMRFYLAQEFYWYNPAKLPAPAEWVTVRKVRVKDAVECIWWLCKTPHPKANNQNVLGEYSPDMQRLLARGYRAKRRPSGHVITSKFRGGSGSIPPNILIFGNNDSNGHYLQACKQVGLKPHPARFPPQLPLFFVRFLTEPGDLVLDPFAGSNTTGEVCEAEARRWIAVDSNAEYVKTSRFRFHRAHVAQGSLFPDPLWDPSMNSSVCP
jgi:DNA modification methylase